MNRCLSLLAFLIVVQSNLLLAADENEKEVPKAKAPLFAEPKKDWEWDKDQRFDFLMERLASLEASIDAIEQASAKAAGKRGAKLNEARRATANNSMMDRRGGGPMKWDQFYGLTAEKFFYHPVDPSTSYHTDTALRQMGSSQDDKLGSGVPASQSLPVHQRPPQWDYIYQANRDATDGANTEADELASKLDELNERRRQLEEEQADLWCRIAFRAIQRLNIPRKPLLRFQLAAGTPEPTDVQHSEALRAATKFLAKSLLIIDKAEVDQAIAFGNVKDIILEARMELDDSLVNLDLLKNSPQDKRTPLGQYIALAQLLDDTSNNLSESYQVAMDGDRFKDIPRKDRFRGLLQRSLVDYSQIILAMDELAARMKTEWKVKVDTKSIVPAVQVTWGGKKSRNKSPLDELEPSVEKQGGVEANTADNAKYKIDPKVLKAKFGASQSAYNEKTGVLSLGYDFKKADQLKDFESSGNPPQLVGKGAIRIGLLETLKHIGRFDEGKISATVMVFSPHETLFSTDKYSFEYHSQHNFCGIRLSSAGGMVEANDGAFFQMAPKSFTLSVLADARKIILQTHKPDVAFAAPPGILQYTFFGNSKGMVIGNLVISGKPESVWFDDFMKTVPL